jgi:hypothetical protein
MSDTYSARCRCGSVQFSCSSPPVVQLVCHCTDCREVARTPFSNLVFFRARDAQVTGETVKREFSADSGSTTVRESCPQCGEMMFDRTSGFPKIIGVVAERLASPFAFAPTHHVWTDSKLPEVELPVGVKAYAQGVPAA